jgi:HSP90 family molecular chaperone
VLQVSETNSDVATSIIGKFGVGFYSAFMVRRAPSLADCVLTRSNRRSARKWL